MVKDFSFQFSPFYVKDLVPLCKRFSIIFQTTLYIYNSRFSCARRNVASRSNDTFVPECKLAATGGSTGAGKGREAVRERRRRRRERG